MIKILNANGELSDVTIIKGIIFKKNNYLIYSLNEIENDNTTKLYTSLVKEVDGVVNFEEVGSEVWGDILTLIIKGLNDGVVEFNFYDFIKDKNLDSFSLEDSTPLKVSQRFFNSLISKLEINVETKSSNEDKTQDNVMNEDISETLSEAKKIEEENFVEKEQVTMKENTTNTLDLDKYLRKETSINTEIFNNSLEGLSFDDVEKNIDLAGNMLQKVVETYRKNMKFKESLDSREKHLQEVEDDLNNQRNKLNDKSSELGQKESDLMHKEQQLNTKETELKLKEKQIQADNARLLKNIGVLNKMAHDVNDTISG